MQVREVMTNNPVCCTPDSTLQEVAQMMVEMDCGCIPVVKDLTGRKPVGTITDRDIVIRTVAAGQNPVPMKAQDIMSIDIATIRPNQSLEECLTAMEEKDIRRILVVDEQGNCCGIVAQEDIVVKNTNPVRTTEYIREISESSPSRTMTRSRDYERNQSYFNSGTMLPVLLGIGSVAALMYFSNQRKSSGREYIGNRNAYSYEHENRQDVTNQESFGRYIDAEEEIEKRQQHNEERVQSLRTDTNAPPIIAAEIHSVHIEGDTIVEEDELIIAVDKGRGANQS
jgi:CBS domain-containing protein